MIKATQPRNSRITLQLKLRSRFASLLLGQLFAGDGKRRWHCLQSRSDGSSIAVGLNPRKCCQSNPASRSDRSIFLASMFKCIPGRSAFAKLPPPCSVLIPRFEDTNSETAGATPERCPSSRSSGSFRRAVNRGADTPAARRNFEGSAKSISPQ
jgi:hypothetical protein